MKKTHKNLNFVLVYANLLIFNDVRTNAMTADVLLLLKLQKITADFYLF